MSRLALEAFGGHHLNVAVAGEGCEAVVALHGFTGNLVQWAPLARAAGGDFRIVMVDLPGHGASDAPDDPALYDLAHTVRALAEVVDRIELSRVHWLGYSLGGRLAIAAAVALPERTLSLTTIGASPGLVSEKERTSRREDDGALARKLESEGITEFVKHWESLPLWKSQARLTPQARRNLHKQRMSNNPLGLANSLRGIGVGSQPDLHRELSTLRVPALFIAGEEDEKYAALAREMSSAVAGSRVEIVPESGHAVHLEQPKRLNHVVLEFLRETPTREKLSAKGIQSNP